MSRRIYLAARLTGQTLLLVLLLWASFCPATAAPRRQSPSTSPEAQAPVPQADDDDDDTTARDQKPQPRNPNAAAEIAAPLPRQESVLQPGATGWAGRLYAELASNALDPARVYRIREASIDREDIHLTFQDGTIAFTKAVDGHITGAFFEGEGEILLVPPDRVERWSLGQFTGSAILEERFASAYLRFNDDTFAELERWLRPVDDAQEFVSRWNPVVLNMSSNGALRVLSSMVDGARTDAAGKIHYERPSGDRVLYARLGGMRLGVFDVQYDTQLPEQIGVAHAKQVEGNWYFDLWSSFPSRSARNAVAGQKGAASRRATITTQRGAELAPPDPIKIPSYKLKIEVRPPHELQVEATLEVQSSEAGHRFLRLELSRYLKLREATADGQPVEFIQNQALEGSALARKGNDVIGIVMPGPVEAGRKIQIRLVYGGDVMQEAGNGLMYVGARGIWYPNRGPGMSSFDMEFRYPEQWTLLATGTRVGEIRTEAVGTPPVPLQVAHWTGDRPIPFAGFNLGKYVKAGAMAGNVVVESYAGHGMETDFKGRQTVLVLPSIRGGQKRPDAFVVAQAPTPANNAQMVAANGAKAVEYLAARLGPYPYSSLWLTQMPGKLSQGWPGLIYLSSYVYLSPDDRAEMNMTKYASTVYGRITEPHEIGHQWFGDLLLWKSYREQWLVEALSEYCALTMLEPDEPQEFRLMLDSYRIGLLARNPNGDELSEAGPPTLGVRLISSRFPDAYDNIAYGRGAWLFHMLREMMLNPAKGSSALAKRGSPDEPFFRVLRKLRDRFEEREISTRDVQQAFEEEWPQPLWYEGHRSLDWFFDGWVNGTSIPRFELDDLKINSKTGTPVATGKIVEKEATEGLVTSLPLYAATSSNNVFLGRVWVEGPETSFRFPVPAGTKRILLDPYETVLTRK